MSTLRSNLLRIAKEHPETRDHLLPLLTQTRTLTSGRVNPSNSFYNDVVAPWEKSLALHRGILSQGAKAPIPPRVSVITGIPAATIQDRFKSDAQELDTIFEDFYNRLLLITEKRAKASFAYFTGLRDRITSGEWIGSIGTGRELGMAVQASGDSSLRSKTIRLAHKEPSLRPLLLPALRLGSAQWEEMNRSDLTEALLDQIWGMYKISYAKLGLKAGSIHEMVNEYDQWMIASSADGTPVAFAVGKTTPYGVKSGFGGSNGSPEGKMAMRSLMSTIYKQPGNYAEVSHAVEHLVTASGAPAICAAYAPQVLKKSVVAGQDGLHYTRNLAGVGLVEKVLVGRPRGIPTTNYTHPSCPVGGSDTTKYAGEEEDTLADHHAHMACLADL